MYWVGEFFRLAKLYIGKLWVGKFGVGNISYCPSRATEAKRSEGRLFRNSIRERGKIKFCASFTTILSYSFKAKGLKFGMKAHSTIVVKLVGQILEFVSKS